MGRRGADDDQRVASTPRFQIDLFYIDHGHHGMVQREEMVYSSAVKFATGSNRAVETGRGVHNAPMLEVRRMLIIDTVQGQS